MAAGQGRFIHKLKMKSITYVIFFPGVFSYLGVDMENEMGRFIQDWGF